LRKRGGERRPEKKTVDTVVTPTPDKQAVHTISRFVPADRETGKLLGKVARGPVVKRGEKMI